MQVMRIFTDFKEFNYQPPNMYYDKASNEVKVKETKTQKRKLIRNTDDLDREKKALYKEVGLDNEGLPKDQDAIPAVADKLLALNDAFHKNYDLDPSGFYVFTRDMMRVDVGLMVQRAPIFMQMRQRDVEFLKFKNDVMQEYYCNTKKYTEEFEEVSRLNEDILGDDPYGSNQNVDNFATHKLTDEATGESQEYAAASKYYKNVDPFIQDRRTIHYAGEDRTYLLFKNKYSQEWEFPTGKMFFGDSFVRAKQTLFTNFAKDWRIKYYLQSPLVSTIREFTEAEKQDKNNNGLKGVRTYFFQAHHWRGLTEMNFEDNDYDDFVWIPKRQLNEYLPRDYYEVFIGAIQTR